MRPVFPLLAFLSLHGCAAAASTEAAQGYPVAIGEAYARLSSNTLDELRYRRQCGILIHINPFGTPGRSVTWIVTSSGREVLRFTADLEAVDADHTKVTVTLPPGPDGREAYGGGQTFVRPAFNQPLRPAIEEQIAAILERRDFDMEGIPRPTDRLCSLQRGSLEQGRPLHLDDVPGTNRPPPPPEAWGSRGRGWGR